MTAPELPTPKRSRWQPLRCGLVELFKYEDEQFFFEDGRLLLRGDNGTGKSRVLALTLPFLLDGRTDAHRVEPDQDRSKNIAWNLLMDQHEQRTGYSWIEFGRLNEQDQPEYFTAGCGLRATKGQAGVTSWFFTTAQRVGDTLALIHNGRVVKKAALNQAFSSGEHQTEYGPGRTYDTATAYRRAVDQTLFGLGEARYDALLNLLIQLRQPQLSRGLNEQLLGEVLSNALPPMPTDVLASVAGAFAALEEDRQKLNGFRDAKAGAADFLEVYQRYLRLEARRQAAPVREAHARYEQALRTANQTRADAEAAQAALATAERQHAELDDAHRKLQSEVETLKESPAMRSAEALRRAGETATVARTQAERAQRAAQRLQADANQHADQRDDALAKAESAADRARVTRDRAARAADPAGLTTRHAEDAAGLASETREAALATLARLDEAAQRQAEAARQLRQLARALRDALAAADQARKAADAQSRRVDEALEAQQAAGRAADAAARQLVADFDAWAANLQHLTLTDTETTAQQLATWANDPDAAPANPAAVATAAALNDRMAALADERAARNQSRDTATARRAELKQEQADLEAFVHRPPDPAPARDAQARTQRPGAAFWQLVDFHDHVNPDQQRGLEAALEGAGLLDAWVTPDGRFQDIDHDALLGTTARHRFQF